MIYEVAIADRVPLKKVVVASSQAVYGEGAYRCDEHGTFIPPMRSDQQLSVAKWEVACPICGRQPTLIETDESQVSPHNQYAISKYTQELVSLNLGRRQQIPTTCMRYSIVQGKWQSFRNSYSGICRVFTLRALHGRRPTAFEDGNQVRDYVWVGDVARANLLALEDPGTDFQSYNVGGAGHYTVMEYGAVVAATLGRPELLPETPALYRFGDTRHVTSSSRSLASLGWTQTLDVPDIVQEYADWAAAQPDAVDNFDASLALMLQTGTVRRAKTVP
jgi:dTDP-L-rhamnose 4-epimerase